MSTTCEREGGRLAFAPADAARENRKDSPITDTHVHEGPDGEECDKLYEAGRALRKEAAALYTAAKMYAVHYEQFHFDPDSGMDNPQFGPLGQILVKAAEDFKRADERADELSEKHLGDDIRDHERKALGGYM